MSRHSNPPLIFRLQSYYFSIKYNIYTNVFSCFFFYVCVCLFFITNKYILCFFLHYVFTVSQVEMYCKQVPIYDLPINFTFYFATLNHLRVCADRKSNKKNSSLLPLH